MRLYHNRKANMFTKKYGQQFLWILFFSLLGTLGLAAVAAAQAPPKSQNTALPPPPPSTIPTDIIKTLQEQIKELTTQSEEQRRRLTKAQEESQSLAVAISTHKTALSLDKITVEQAKELRQYYTRHLEQRLKALTALEQEQEKYGKILAELTEASKKTELEKTARPPAKTAAQRALEQQWREQQMLAKTAISRLEEIQQTIKAHVELLTQEKELLLDFSQQLETYAAERYRQQLLERQQPSDILALAREVMQAALTLPQRLAAMLEELIQSGAASRLLTTYRSQLIGLLIFLILLLYSMRQLRRASREFRQNLAAKAQTFTLKLIMALVNALAHNYYLLALITWLGLTLYVTQVFDRILPQMVLGGLFVITGISLLKHLLWAMFAPGEPDQGIMRLPDPTARFYYRYGLLTLSFALLGYYLLWCLRLAGMEGPGYDFAVLMYMLAVILWFFWLLRKPHLENLLLGAEPPQQRRLSGLIRSVRLLVILGLSLIIIVDLLGFQNLALYLAGAFFLSTLMLAGGWLLQHVGNDLIAALTSPRGFLAGTKRWEPQTLASLHLSLTYALNTAVVLITLAGVFFSWGADLGVIKKILAALAQGPTLGPVTLSPMAILLAGASLWFTRQLSRFSRLVLESGIFRQRQWDVGIQHTIANTVHYALMTVGILVALGFLGINLASLAIIAGGLGVGIGFGLQNIVNNFFSGLILLFERPIKVGDLLIIDGQWGTVKAIRVRSTVFETAERSVLIIPNSDLLSNKILNWTFYGRGPNRLALKISVAYDSEVNQVTRILDQICRQNHRVLPEPPPQVFFSAYGDSSLDFTVWVFLRSPADRVPATHELHSAIFDTFREKGVVFPYPQMDVHLRTLPPQPSAPVPAPPVFTPPETEEQ